MNTRRPAWSVRQLYSFNENKMKSGRSAVADGTNRGLTWIDGSLRNDTFCHRNDLE
jgi:hypothetical protein